MCVEPKSTRIKLIDFGLARQLEHGRETKITCGTPEFVGMLIKIVLLFDDDNNFYFHNYFCDNFDENYLIAVTIPWQLQ